MLQEYDPRKRIQHSFHSHPFLPSHPILGAFKVPRSLRKKSKNSLFSLYLVCYIYFYSQCKWSLKRVRELNSLKIDDLDPGLKYETCPC